VVADAVSVAKCCRWLPHLSRLDLLQLNAKEAEALSGLPVSSPVEARLAVDWLLQQGVHRVVLSLAKQGIVWADSDGAEGRSAAPQVKVLSTSGAGDALLSGTVHGLVQRLDLSQCVAMGLRCAAATLAVYGANDPLLRPEHLKAPIHGD